MSAERGSTVPSPDVVEVEEGDAVMTDAGGPAGGADSSSVATTEESLPFTRLQVNWFLVIVFFFFLIANSFRFCPL
jgi:hypothetical protein